MEENRKKWTPGCRANALCGCQDPRLANSLLVLASLPLFRQPGGQISRAMLGKLWNLHQPWETSWFLVSLQEAKGRTWPNEGRDVTGLELLIAKVAPGRFLCHRP